MSEVELLTAAGTVTLFPGDKFQTLDKKKEPCLYQYLGLMDEGIGTTVYMHDETHGKFCNVSFGWFESRVVRKIGGDDF